VEIPLESFDEGELNNRLVKLGLLPFLANSRVAYEVVRMYRTKLLLKTGFKSVYSMSDSLLERAYAPYPDEVWRVITSSGYREPVHIHDTYHVTVDIPKSGCEYYVKVGSELLNCPTLRRHHDS
jgi:hypothetical protein